MSNCLRQVGTHKKQKITGVDLSALLYIYTFHPLLSPSFYEKNVPAGFCARFFLISSKEAPTIARWNLVVLRLRRFCTSSTLIFLCNRRQPWVQTKRAAFLRWLYRPLVLAVEKTRVALSRRTKRMPCPGYTYREKGEKEGDRKRVRVCSHK